MTDGAAPATIRTGVLDLNSERMAAGLGPSEALTALNSEDALSAKVLCFAGEHTTAGAPLASPSVRVESECVMAFFLAFERTHRVLRATATGVIATQDLEALDIASIVFLSREQTTDGPPIRGLYNFRDVAAIAVPQTTAAARGSCPAIVRGPRVMVQSRTIRCDVMETFLQSQRLAGGSLLTVVASLDEAHAILGLNAPNFELIE